MRLPEGIDSLDAGGAVLGLHLIQPVEQRQDLVGLDPLLADLAGDVVTQVQLVHQPFRQGTPRLGPGREGEDDGDRVCRVVHGAVQQVAGQLQEQRRLPRARRTQDEERLVHGVVDIHDLGAGWQRSFDLIRALDQQVQGSHNGIGSLVQADEDARLWNSDRSRKPVIQIFRTFSSIASRLRSTLF